MRLLQALLPALVTLGALCPGAAASGALTSLVATSPAPAGKVFMDRDEALELAFPGCAVKRTTVYLDREQVKLIEQRSRVSFEGSMLYPYRAMRDGKLEWRLAVGVALISACLMGPHERGHDVEGRLARGGIVQWQPRGALWPRPPPALAPCDSFAPSSHAPPPPPPLPPHDPLQTAR